MKGKVYLVGAGPGDWELITLKGLKALETAEVLVYDRLVSNHLIKRVPVTCELIYVGKKASDHTLDQSGINDLLIQKAREGKKVVRLKGGDPYVFGRGGEEGEALLEKGLDFEVIPGITSAIGGLAYAGIPITHRNYASSFHVITGHLKSDEMDHDWQAIAQYEGTLVFLMGLGNLSKIQERLIANGKSADTPAALVEWATTPWQRKLVTTLGKLSEEAKREAFKSPSLIVIGDVVNAHEALDFKSRLPLYGKTIAVTRGRDQASRLVEQLETLGAEVIETPMIRIQPTQDPELQVALKELSIYTHLIFTSVNGVNIFFKALYEAGKDARALSHLKCTVIGSATKEALFHKGVVADYVPAQYVAEAVWDVLEPVIKSEDRVLVPRAKHARSFLTDALANRCIVKEIAIYEALPEKGDHMTDEILDRIDYVTFTSSSTVKHFFAEYGTETERLFTKAQAVTIGPITSETLKEYKVSTYIEAKVFNVEGLVEALLEEVRQNA